MVTQDWDHLRLLSLCRRHSWRRGLSRTSRTGSCNSNRLSRNECLSQAAYQWPPTIRRNAGVSALRSVSNPTCLARVNPAARIRTKCRCLVCYGRGWGHRRCRVGPDKFMFKFKLLGRWTGFRLGGGASARMGKAEGNACETWPLHWFNLLIK